MVVRLMQAGCMDYEIIISGPAAGADHRRANSVAHFASGAVRADDIICFDGLDFVRIAPAGPDENLVTPLLKAEDRKSAVVGKRVSISVALGCPRNNKKKQPN